MEVPLISPPPTQKDPCAICLEPLNKRWCCLKERIIFHDGIHQVHQKCISSWVKQQIALGKTPTCHLCRAPIDRNLCLTRKDRIYTNIKSSYAAAIQVAPYVPYVILIIALASIQMAYRALRCRK